MKVVFAAMSGLRAWDTDLLELGLSMPGFLERGRAIASLPSLGLLTIAGMTDPRRHERIYLDVPDVDQAVAAFPPADLVCISSFTAQMPEAYRLADILQGRGIRVVIGGLHASALPVEALSHADAVAVGAGESSWPRILADAETGTLAGIYRGEEVSLAGAPLPAFELLAANSYNRLTLQTTRGCPHRCSFCASSILYCQHYHQKPLDRLKAELDAIQAIWPRPFIELADDNSLLNARYWNGVLAEFATRKIRWFTETDISVARKPEILDQLRDAGCRELLIGLESPVEEGLDGLELRANWKQRMQPHYQEAIAAIQGAGIRVNGCFIVGLDGHGPGIFDAIERAVEELALYDVQVTLPTAFPGTPLYQTMLAEERLLYPTEWGRYTLFDVTIAPQGMTVQELESGFRSLVTRLYSEDATRQRKRRFRNRFGVAASAICSTCLGIVNRSDRWCQIGAHCQLRLVLCCWRVWHENGTRSHQNGLLYWCFFHWLFLALGACCFMLTSGSPICAIFDRQVGIGQNAVCLSRPFG